MIKFIAFFAFFSFLSTSCLAQSMVTYPLTGSDPKNNAGAYQTTSLHSIPIVQPNPWLLFFPALQSCQPGTYTLPQIDPILINNAGNVAIYEILELQDNKCVINITLKSNMTNAISSSSRCKLAHETIDLLIARYTNFINNRNAGFNTDEDLYNQKMQNECKS